MIHLPVDVEQRLASILRRHPSVRRAILFGSRAKGSSQASSDIDLALAGQVTAFEAESVAMELNELPTPYVFDVKALAAIEHEPLLDHIKRAGVVVYEREQAASTQGAAP
jgi:predicted nucleotidyltransferase